VLRIEVQANSGSRRHFVGRATFIPQEVFSDMAPSLFECRVCGTSFVEYDLYIRHEGSCVTRTVVLARDVEPLRSIDGDAIDDPRNRDRHS
jgi:hypothetical protein